MKSLTSRFLASLLLAFSSMIYAANDHTNIVIEVIQVESLKLIGSLLLSDTKLLDANDIRPANKNGPNQIVSLGTLGLEASFTGSCTLDFVSTNGFTLNHSIKIKQIFTDYQLIYTPSATTHTFGSDTSITLPCNTEPVALEFQAVGNIKNKVKAGVYSDTINITVTSP